ncbi:glycosyl hydrolase family 18 protein [Gottfriedia acidiceleris]|uniref:Glycosyl hydrolase family 18 protein n=1 Tax=Gottfriedia acidiceleris TaxID=371036 RepID=A0ABY4JPV5_9BACI|nr:glycosyl hydrolase family 18 protein [Gottfriedia acidiceleris]UPM55872.1 glycosyl hydrolase family 18 protein [Gottfriedia acidiceleris]
MELFKRFEINEINNEINITLYLTPFLEEFGSELGDNQEKRFTSLKKAAIDYIQKSAPQIKNASITIVAGSVILSTFPLKSSAHVANFNMSYLFFGNTETYLNQIDKTQGNLDLVAPSFFDLNADGTLKITSQFNVNLVNEIHKKNIRIVPFLSNHWDRELGRKALANRELLSTQIADFIMQNNLDGVNIDIENVTDDDRDAYTDLVRLLRNKLPKEKEVSVAVAANPHGWTEGWHGSYDYKELEKYADYIFIMAYDEHYQGGPAGPVASINWVDKSIQYALNQGVPKEEIVLGIPFFGRYWKEGSSTGGGGVPVNQVESLIAKYKGIVTYDAESQSPKATITIKEGDTLPVIHGITLQPGTYVFWYENLNSIKAKVDLVHKYEIKGTGSWSLGNENTSIWANYNRWLTTHDERVTIPPPVKKTTVTYPNLKAGTKGSDVKKLQVALKTHKFYKGNANGIYDTGTKNAVIAFQKKYKLKVDGIAGKGVQSKLYSLKAPKTYALLKQGSKGKNVIDLQNALKKLGDYNGTANGVYDSKTKAAVMNFQKRNKLKVDGIAGKQTQSKLFAIIK